jgi:patatin-like phospholipase/acyl hydrolase
MAHQANTGRINILSVDGGGIRGIIPAVILAAMRERIGHDLHQVVDLISGTSTGGIIALGIGTGAKNGRPYQPAELVEMYVANGPAIFRKRWCTRARELVGPKYSPDALEKVLGAFFGETELRSALTPLLVSSYDLQSQKPFFFKSHKIGADLNWNWPVRLVVRATSAAPTFFPPLRLKGKDGEYVLIDGGVFVNNPAMAAGATSSCSRSSDLRTRTPPLARRGLSGGRRADRNASLALLARSVSANVTSASRAAPVKSAEATTRV